MRAMGCAAPGHGSGWFPSSPPPKKNESPHLFRAQAAPGCADLLQRSLWMESAGEGGGMEMVKNEDFGGVCLHPATLFPFSSGAPADVTATPGAMGIGINPINPGGCVSPPTQDKPPPAWEGGVSERRDTAGPLLPPARLEMMMKALPHRRDGEHSSCLHCRRGLGVGGGLCQPPLPALLLRSARSGFVVPRYPILPGEDQPTSWTKGLFIRAGDFPPRQKHRAGCSHVSPCPHSQNGGALGSCGVSWGGRHPGAPPSLPREGLGRGVSASRGPAPAPRFPPARLDGAKGGFRVPPGCERVSLLRQPVPGAGGGDTRGRLGRSVGWGWATRAPALC